MLPQHEGRIFLQKIRSCILEPFRSWV